MLSRGWLVSLSRQEMLECLACGHENKPGDKFCAQCASSLDLKLCSVCEAMNASADVRCYKCGGPLWAEPQAPVPVPVQNESLPANRMSKGVMLLFFVPIVLLAGTVAFFNAGIWSFHTGPALTAVASMAEARTNWTPVSLSVAHVTPAVVREQAVSSVTHTRVAPVATTVAAAAPAPELSREKLEAPAIAPVSEIAAQSYARVTHTKPQHPAKSGAHATPVVAAVSAPGEETIDAREEQRASCEPGVAALGLCISK
jgi:hypothetical protein